MEIVDICFKKFREYLNLGFELVLDFISNIK